MRKLFVVFLVAAFLTVSGSYSFAQEVRPMNIKAPATGQEILERLDSLKMAVKAAEVNALTRVGRVELYTKPVTPVKMPPVLRPVFEPVRLSEKWTNYKRWANLEIPKR